MELPSFLAESANIYFIKIDSRKRLVSSNRLFNEKFPVPNNNLDTIIKTEDLPLFSRAIQDCVSGKSTLPVIDMGCKSRTGKNVPIRWEFTLDKDPAASIPMIIGIGCDIANEMQGDEKRYHSLFEQASDPIMITGFDGNFIDVNTAMCNMFGYTREELLNMNIRELIDPGQLREVPIRFDLLARGQHIFSHRKMKHRNGSVIEVEANVKKINDEMVMAIARDVTELKKAEASLVAHEKQLMLFVEHSPAAIAMFDTDMRYINVSQQWLTEYRLTGKQLIGKLHYDIFPWIPQRWKDVHQRCLKGATEKNDEDHFVREDGSVDWLRWEVHPWYKASGKIGGIIMLTEVITEKKLLQARILEQQVQEQKKISRAIIKAQEKERNLIGQELHDNVNQILAGTKLYLQIAAKKDKKVQQLVKYPMELIDSSINEIRLLSSRQVTPLKNIKLKELIGQLLEGLRKNMKLKTSFTCNIAGKLIDDELKLNIYRIIQEQVSNISKYASANKVSVSVKAVAGNLEVLIADDGVGFDTNKKRKGIGISNMINRANAFNGEVLVESSPGKGSRIKLRIPLTHPEK